MDKIDTSTAAIAKLMDGVTPGPWAYNVLGLLGPLHTEDDQAYGMICDVVCDVNFDAEHMGNARFIAAARALVPALLAERDDLRAKLDAVVESLENVMGYVDTPISRRRICINNDQPEWLITARAALAAWKDTPK